jgi:hypothetical protein
MGTIPNPFETAARYQQALHEAGIESVVIGGLAVTIWGEPRATKDADLRVQLQRDEAEKLLAALPSNLTFPGLSATETPLEKLQQYGFLFTETDTQDRVDVMLTDTAFDAAVIERGTVQKIPGSKIQLWVCSPEDLIIYKLISTRPRDHADAASVVKRQIKKLDHNYVEDWLQQFEMALDDSTLIAAYRKMVADYSS